MIAAATIIAKPDLALGRVLATSFHQFHPDIPFYALLADEVDGYFEPATEPFRLVHLNDLGIPELPRFRSHYNRQALTYAATPYLLSHLLRLGYDGVAFFKQESLVVGDLAPILKLLDRHAIVLTPHLLQPLSGAAGIERELTILRSGVYNVGFIGVTARPTAHAFLDWWQARLNEHCRFDVAQGMHYEQRWLDLVPTYFDDVVLVRDPGFNIGHWNLPERQVHFVGETITVDGYPCRFVRFSGYDADYPQAVTRYSYRLSLANVGPAAILFRRYHALLVAAGYHQCKHWPYAYDRFDKGVGITSWARRLYQLFNRRTQGRFGSSPLVVRLKRGVRG